MNALRRELALLSLLAVAFPRVAHAQSDRSAAVALFDEGVRLETAQDYAHACPKFAESNRIDPQLGALLHLADCYEKAGQTASAWGAFRDAAEIAERRGDERGRGAREHAAALEAKLSRLLVSVAPEAEVPGIEVTRDGSPLSAATLGERVPVDPGEHVVQAKAPGKLTWQTTVIVNAPGDAVSVVVPALLDAAAPPPPPVGPTNAPAAIASPPDQPARSGSTQRLAGWVGVGAGALGIGVGVVFELVRSAKVSDRDAICPSSVNCTVNDQTRIDALTSDARSANTIGSIGLIGGGVLAAGGLALLLTAPHDHAQVALMPTLGPGFQGVMVSAHGF